MKRFIIHDDLYSARYHVYFGGKLLDARNDFGKRYRLKFESAVSADRAAETFYAPNRKIIGMWFKRVKPSPRMISHECYHAVRHIMRLTFIPAENSTEEVWAYYLDWLVGNIWNKRSRK